MPPIYKKTSNMEQQPLLNEHNKQEYPPMHTCEHIVNRTMVNLFGCGRAVSAHIERKKSKLDFQLPQAPETEDITRIGTAPARYDRIYHPTRSIGTFRPEASARKCFRYSTSSQSR